MNTKLCVDCFMVESAEKFIYLLSKPITTHRILDRKNEHDIDLYECERACGRDQSSSSSPLTPRQLSSSLKLPRLLAS